MKILRSIVVVLVAIVGVAAVVGLFLPSDISVSRSTTIDAPKGEVFTIVNSLRAFSRWSPWTERDPNIKFSFEGPDAGVGQKMKWESPNANIGTGSMEIADSLTNEKVVMKIVFAGARNAGTSLVLDDVAGRTKVTWNFAYSVGGNPFARYVGLIMPSVIGNEYARGLASLKRYVEAIPKIDFSDLQVTRVSVAPQTLISVSESGTDMPEGMSNALGAGFAALTGALQGAGLAADGQPISVAKGVSGDKVTIETSLPVKELPQSLKLPEGIRGGKSGDGEALRVAFKGDYASLQTIYVKLLAYALTNGWKVRGSTWNEYVGDPAKVGTAPLELNIYLPVE